MLILFTLFIALSTTLAMPATGDDMGTQMRDQGATLVNQMIQQISKAITDGITKMISE
jgi:hypothetical protein